LLQAEAFLDRRRQFARVPVTADELFGMNELVSAEGDLRTLPCHLADRGGMDGFYAARFRRTL
jgi:16S rRNA (cytosine967-C5)-methyltransferase